MDAQVAISDVVNALKLAASTCREGLDVISVDFSYLFGKEPRIRVHVHGPLTLKEIPGPFNVTYETGQLYPYKVSKQVDGVEFFCVCDSGQFYGLGAEVREAVANA